MKAVVAALDWGLGHATRCIPVVRSLLSRNVTVLLAGTGDSIELLREEFPDLATLELPSYAIEYPRSGSMALKMLKQLPRLRKVIKREHAAIEEAVTREHIDLVISDNRYGCWSSKVPSILITHQTTILLPQYLSWMRKTINWYNRRLIHRFTQCWIPDSPGAHSLAGRLARVPDATASHFRFIGNLSRFGEGDSGRASSQPLYDIVVLLSGPEPQRTLFEDLVCHQLRKTSIRAFVVRGAKHPVKPLPEGIAGIDFLNGKPLAEMLQSASCVLARSGYSTIMDLARLGKKAIFVPTPGQTEQEYLARRLKKMKLAYSVSQRQFNLKRAMRASKSYTGFFFMPDRFNMLAENIDSLLSWMHNRNKNGPAR